MVGHFSMPVDNGDRDDIYNLAKKLLRLGLLNEWVGQMVESLTCPHILTFQKLPSIL
jgi:hypothetical protein